MDRAQLTELKPVILANDDYDETSLKEPCSRDGMGEFSSSQTYVKTVKMESDSNTCGSPERAAESTIYDSQGSFRCESGQPASIVNSSDTKDMDDALVYLGTEMETSSIENMIERLANVFRRLPRDSFVNKIIECYGTCERLESVRSAMFHYIKGYDEFPYGSSVELKRRVQTRAGDPVVAKLAKDIHCLMAVIEGADYSELSDLMSLSRQVKSSRAASSSQMHNVQCNCSCDVEIKSLRDTVAMLSADVVLLKQNRAADQARVSQMKTINHTVTHIKADISRLKEHVTMSFNDTKMYIERFQSEKSNGITSLRSETKCLSEKLKNCEETLDNLNLSELRLPKSKNRGKRQNKGAAVVTDDTDSHAVSACASLSPDITVSVEQPGPNAATSNNIDHDIDMNMDSGGTCTRVVTDSCGTGAMQASSYYTASRCGAGQGLGGGFIVSPTCREPGTSTGNEMVNFSPNLVKAPSQTAGQADIVTTESGVANDTTRRTSSSHWQSSGGGAVLQRGVSMSTSESESHRGVDQCEGNNKPSLGASSDIQVADTRGSPYCPPPTNNSCLTEQRVSMRNEDISSERSQSSNSSTVVNTSVIYQSGSDMHVREDTDTHDNNANSRARSRSRNLLSISEVGENSTVESDTNIPVMVSNTRSRNKQGPVSQSYNRYNSLRRNDNTNSRQSRPQYGMRRYTGAPSRNENGSGLGSGHLPYTQHRAGDDHRVTFARNSNTVDVGQNGPQYTQLSSGVKMSLVNLPQVIVMSVK
ncbi:MAG: hypothetical protein ABW185_24765 [Sedimenticola sp.]